MAYDALTTSGINTLVTSYSTNEKSKLITPLNSRKTQYQNLVNAWNGVYSKLTPFINSVKSLKATGTDSIFTTSYTAASSNTSFVSVSSSGTLDLSSYALRVNQLAKNDSVVSESKSYSTTFDNLAGNHTLKFKSGAYETNVEVALGTGETNQTVMQKIRDAINSDTYAKVQSSSFNPADSISSIISEGTHSFDINLNGTTTTVDLDNSGWTDATTYNDLMDQMVTSINSAISGVTASKVTDSTTGQVRLNIQAKSSSDFVTINSGNSNALLNTLGISANSEKGASSLISASVFSPTSSTAKLSISAKNSGFDNRLVISSEASLDQLGLTSDVLNNRYRNTSDGTTTSSTMAGFLYGSNWSGSGLVESEENNLLNSKISFNGITIQRNSNTISDLVNGMTFSLKSVMSGSDSDVNVSVSKSTSNVRSQIDTFISKFNELFTSLDSKMYVDTTLGRGIFQGDTSATGLVNSLKGLAMSTVTGLADGNLNSLAKIGIKFDKDAGLSVSDSTLLNNSIENKLTQVEAVFNSENGIATKLYDTVSKYEGSTGSVYKTITRYNSTITNISDRITSTQSRIDKSSEVLRKKYTALQTQLAAVLNMQSALESIGMFTISE